VYQNYGGRGISYHPQWRDFRQFEQYILDNLGKKPSRAHTLDRIDNDGDYEPGNIRWATHSQQVNNRRIFRNNKSGYVGVSWYKAGSKWKAQIRLNGKKIGLGYYNSVLDAHQAYQQALKRRQMS
jgi:hypothetical protein